MNFRAAGPWVSITLSSATVSVRALLLRGPHGTGRRPVASLRTGPGMGFATAAAMMMHRGMIPALGLGVTLAACSTVADTSVMT